VPRLPEKPTYADMDGLRKGIEQADGQTVIALAWELRLAAGESRLNERARIRVEDVLRGAGLVAIPSVPENQKVEVLVTRAGSAVEKLWQAFHGASPQNLGLILRSADVAEDAVAEREALADLRELLGEAQELADRVGGGTV
jgi:hypothetical protein